MFYNGIGPTPPTIPTEYDLSSGCDSVVVIPASDIEAGDITICGSPYSIDTVFADQASFLTFLNGTFLSTFGLSGSFYIDDDNHLIYSTTAECTGTNCIEMLDSITTETGIPFTTEDGYIFYVES